MYPIWASPKGGGMRRNIVGFMTVAITCAMLLGATAARADQTVTWTGNGLDSVTTCIKGVDKPHLHWVLTPGSTPVPGTTAELFMNGKDVGTMSSVGSQGALQLTISVGSGLTIEQLEAASVYADITAGS